MLMHISKARQEIEAAKTVDEAKAIRDKAEAARVYAKSAGAALDLQNEVAEIKIRAEYKAGQLLSEMGLRGGDRRSKSHDVTLKLRDLDITKNESWRWQLMCELPPNLLDEFIARVKANGEMELTSNATVKAARNFKQKSTKHNVSEAESHGLITDLNDLVAKGAKFPTIYADPPWSYSNTKTRSAVGGANTAAYKSTMTIEEICAEPVSQLVTDKAHLHLWTTNAFLFEARKVMEAWGFEYKSCFVWVKPQMGIGNYWRVSHEFMLLGVRGDLRFLDWGCKSWLEVDRTKHSRKPRQVRELIEKVSPGPYLELYGREPLDGQWSVYGNEVETRLFA